MKKLFIICAILLTTTVLYAQENMSVIKLKSGIEIKGTIVEEVPGGSVSIRTIEGDVFIYRQSEIARIDNPNLAKIKAEERKKEVEAKLAETKAKLAKKEESKALAKSMRQERALGNFKGYRGFVDVFVGANLGYWLAYYWGGFHTRISFINGYNFGPYFYLGVGVGWQISQVEDDFDYRPDPVYNVYQVPIFLHIRSSWAKERRVSPYFSLNVGYNLAISKAIYESDYRYLDYYKPNEILIEPSLGIEIRTSRRTAVSVAFSAPIGIGVTGGIGLTHTAIPLGASVGFSF